MERVMSSFWLFLFMVVVPVPVLAQFVTGTEGNEKLHAGPPPTVADLDASSDYRLSPIYGIERVVEGGDTVYIVHIKPVYIFDHPVDTRKYQKLIRNLKVVYPIAQYANRRLREMEKELDGMDPKSHRQYVKEVEKELKEQYTPILKKMSFSQGKMLIKLIDRETGRTSYELVKDLRGSFRAFFWQGIARMFGANLKETFDKNGEDRILEELILLFEAGLI